MSTPDPAWRIKRTPCPFYQSGRCIFKHKCNFIHDGEISMRRPDVRAHAPVYRRTPENSVDSFSSSEEDEPVQEHRIDEHSAAAPSLIFSSIYGPRPNSINRLQLTNVDLPVSPESLPHTPPRTSRPTSHHSTHNHVNITSPTPSRPLSSSLGIGIGGRAQGGLAEVFTAIANTQTLAQSTTLPPSSAGSLPSPLSLSPKSPANGAQEIIIKDEGYSLEQLPFKLALSNQSSLLLNRTSRAAQRRSSTFSQQDTPSSSGADIEKRPNSLSVPERLSTGSLPKYLGDRPISVTSVEQIEEEGKVDDEQDEEEQVIVDESPSFEALQPYPRDVSTEPSPDPTRQNFVPPAPAPAPAPPLPPAQPSKPPVRNNSSRHIDHELVIDELEERLGVSPTRRRRARSNAVPNPIPSAVSPNRSTTQPTGKSAEAIWERKQPIEIPKSAVNMGAAWDMLDAMFSKRNQQQEERIEEESSDEHENEQSFLPVDWDVGSMAGLDEEDRFEKHDDPVRLEPTMVQVAARSDSVATQRESTTTRREPAIPQDEPSAESRKSITVRRESTPLRPESTPVRPESTTVRRESISVRRESTSVHHEPAPVRRESISVRRESVGAQRKSAPRASIPVPISQPSPPILQAEGHPQTPSTPSTEPETPNTRLTQSTQPTPQSDHEFDEADTDDEHPEDLADLIEAEPVVLSTPRSVVLRREVGRETSLPSRAGTSTGAGTPGFWTPRHGSVVGGSGGLQVIESPTVEQIQPEQSQFEQRLSAERNFSTPSERRLSVEQNRPTLIERRRSSRLASIERRQSAQLASAERRQSTSSRRLEDITQSTVSESTLNTIGGQTENESPYVRTATLASEPRASSEPSSKPRPRSQLKPLRLSLMHGLGTPSPSAIITPVSANTATPSPGFRSDAATPTPTAMYPTPSSAHPTQLPARLRSATQSPPPTEEMVDNDSISESLPKTSGAESVSWFGSKKGVKRGTLSASRQSFRRSVHETEPTLSMRDTTITSPGRSSASVVVERIEESSPQSPGALAEDEDVRPLPMIWDDETEAGSKAGSSRQGTRSPTRTIPMLDSFPPDSASIEVAPPLKSPDRLDTVPRYPTFVNIGGSPRLSEAKPPPPSPPAVLENVSESHNIQPSEVEPAALRSRKWADTVNQDSIGSLPDFSAPAPGTQMLDVQPAEADEPHTPRTHKDRLRYMPIPNTAPLSISPRRASPSMMQLPQEGSTESYEQQGEYDQDGMLSYAAPHMAPLDLRLRMPRREGTTGPWMTEHFTNSPSSFHSSQVGSMHSASSSLSTGSKAMDIRRSISFNKLMNGPVHVEDGTFGNPGPGPTTMMTYSKRGQPVETLGSPIVLQPSSLEHAPSVPKTPQHHVPTEMIERTSRQPSSTSLDATPRKSDDLLSLKISPAQIATEAEMNIHPATPSVSTQSPIQNHGNEFSPVEQRTPYKALSLSSPSPVPYPSTPLTAPSPLQILRRNLMARTSPESPRFLSPQTRFTNLPESRPPRHQHHASASLAPSTRPRDEFHNMPMSAPGPRDRRSLTPNTRFAATPSIPGSPAQSVHSTISQTKPLLFFAIAKNSAQEVERLLQDGEVKPNDKAGPEDLPALAFALANEQLTDKTQIVKSLLSHGADPSSVLHRQTGSGQFDDADLALTTRIEQGMNPAIRYYLNRKQMTIPAPQAELLEKNNFGGLTRAGFSIIGQDAALEELIRVVAGHCRRKALNPLVVVFSGGPGCGKSLLASKIGPLLHVPYFTINMTNLRNEAALFNYISMTTKVGQPKIPLMDFLRDNQGQRCVVVLEEIEKAADKTVWHSLLMPWELGKATVISPLNNEQIDIDTSQVIWIATSNSGDDATLKFFAERSRPSDRGESALARLAHNPRPKEDNFTRNDYLKLMQAVRKRLGELLGSSMISRVSSVLPFLPFTEDEVYALASESLSAMRAEQKGDQSYDSVDWDELLQQAVGEYIPGEGARSVHRAVQRAFDEVAEW